ncbi:MAG TPA: DUF3455 domain-containing protein, partial [Gemmatimonadaceae bacterium]|nr:DUF3455 domain-containing protein [Gemmatimonadaceae bacterium]
MKTTTIHRFAYSFVLAATALLAGCLDGTPVSPDRMDGSLTPTKEASADDFAITHNAAGRSASNRAADLGACDNLRPPAGSMLAFRVFAKGVQIYRWTGGSWGFAGPSAVLASDAEGNGIVGTHYAGPTGPVWESNTGGKLVGAVVDRCTPNPNAIAWLLLSTVADGPGVFHRVKFIQRVNTVGGKEP